MGSASSASSKPWLMHKHHRLESKRHVLQNPTCMVLHNEDLLVLDTRKNIIHLFDATSGQAKGTVLIYALDGHRIIFLPNPCVLLLEPTTQLFVLGNREQVWLLQRVSPKHLELKRSFRCPVRHAGWMQNKLLVFQEVKAQLWTLQGARMEHVPSSFETKGEPIVSVTNVHDKDHIWLATAFHVWCVRGRGAHPKIKHCLLSKSPITAVTATEHFLVLGLGIVGLWSRLVLFHISSGELLQQADLGPKQGVSHLVVDTTRHKLFVSCGPEAKVFVFRLHLALFDEKQVHQLKAADSLKKEAWFEWHVSDDKNRD